MFLGMMMIKRAAGSQVRGNILRMTRMKMSGEGSSGAFLDALPKPLMSVKPGTLGSGK